MNDIYTLPASTTTAFRSQCHSERPAGAKNLLRSLDFPGKRRDSSSHGDATRSLHSSERQSAVVVLGHTRRCKWCRRTWRWRRRIWTRRIGRPRRWRIGGCKPPGTQASVVENDVEMTISTNLTRQSPRTRQCRLDMMPGRKLNFYKMITPQADRGVGIGAPDTSIRAQLFDRLPVLCYSFSVSGVKSFSQRISSPLDYMCVVALKRDVFWGRDRVLHIRLSIAGFQQLGAGLLE